MQITLEIISLQGRMTCLMRCEASLFNLYQSAVSRFLIQFLQYRSIEAAAFCIPFLLCAIGSLGFCLEFSCCTQVVLTFHQ